MSLFLKALFFILAALAITWISKSCLLNIRSHGFYRFFAWLAIIALILLNIDYWFVNPLSSLQIISWVLLLLSIVTVVYGAYSLHKSGRPSDKREDAVLMGIEKTTELVTTGAYRFIRHPIYSSFLYGAWGVFLKNCSWPGLCLAGLTTVFAIAAAKVEEAENIRFFGETYRIYIKRTRMLIPFLF